MRSISCLRIRWSSSSRLLSPIRTNTLSLLEFESLGLEPLQDVELVRCDRLADLGIHTVIVRPHRHPHHHVRRPRASPSLAIRSKTASEPPTFVLIGPNGSGKTSLLTLVSTIASLSSPEQGRALSKFQSLMQTRRYSSPQAPSLKHTPHKQCKPPTATSRRLRKQHQISIALPPTPPTRSAHRSDSSTRQAMANCDLSLSAH